MQGKVDQDYFVLIKQFGLAVRIFIRISLFRFVIWLFFFISLVNFIKEN